MRLNIVIDPDEAAAVEERAAEEGISRPEWARRAISAALCRGLYRLGTQDVQADVPDRTDEIALLEEKIQTLSTVEEERDRLKEQVMEMDRLRIELISRDHLLAERASEISYLRGECSKMSDRLMPAALPEKAGTGRRPWWKFWE